MWGDPGHYFGAKSMVRGTRQAISKILGVIQGAILGMLGVMSVTALWQGDKGSWP